MIPLGISGGNHDMITEETLDEVIVILTGDVLGPTQYNYTSNNTVKVYMYVAARVSVHVHCTVYNL